MQGPSYTRSSVCRVCIDILTPCIALLLNRDHRVRVEEFGAKMLRMWPRTQVEGSGEQYRSCSYAPGHILIAQNQQHQVCGCFRILATLSSVQNPEICVTNCIQILISGRISPHNPYIQLVLVCRGFVIPFIMCNVLFSS